LLFTLRGVDQAELLSSASSTTMADLSSGSELAGADLSALFGIDIAMDAVLTAELEPPAKKRAPNKKSGRAGRAS
jgi:hypothetical protein